MRWSRLRMTWLISTASTGNRSFNGYGFRFPPSPSRSGPNAPSAQNETEEFLRVRGQRQ